MAPLPSLLARLTVALLASLAAHASADPATVVHLVDYVAVDYREAVRDGKVLDEGEYREMREFAAHIDEAVRGLPEDAARAGIVSSAATLRSLVEARAPDAEVAAAASALRRAIVGAYRIAVGPRLAPDLGQARQDFARLCAGCHGADGRGDGALARGMDPVPTDFTDASRASRRSVHGLYNAITLGVEGTAMRAFTELDEGRRWGLAYVAAGWSAEAQPIARGKAAWESGRYRDAFASHAAVASATPAEIARTMGGEAADVLAYLRKAPRALEAAKPDPIAFARAKVRESVELHRAGRPGPAREAALAAYLEGFELAEAALAAVDAAQVRRVESLMMAHRDAIQSRASVEEVQARAAAVDAALEAAAGTLAGPALSPLAAGVASFVILLREGLEAVLVVVALLAFARRGGSPRTARYLHAGWVGALVAGVATWAAATWLVALSGAGREVTEGVAALAASLMLLYVGFWLHDKSHAAAWQAFVMRGAAASGPGAAWGLATMAFLAVYREVFETILFYQALWSQAAGAGAMIVAGFALAVLALAGITWAMLRYAVRLPLATFFGASGVLLAALAVVLAGNGVAALQEAGVVDTSPIPFVAVAWLGIHPNVQALAAQAAVAVAAVALFTLSRRRARAAPAAAAAD